MSEKPMLINSSIHIDVFRRLTEFIEAYRNMGLRTDPIKIASVLDQSNFAASWGSTVWTMDDIRNGTATLDIMEKIVEPGPGTIREAIYRGA